MKYDRQYPKCRIETSIRRLISSRPSAQLSIKLLASELTSSDAFLPDRDGGRQSNRERSISNSNHRTISTLVHSLSLFLQFLFTFTSWTFFKNFSFLARCCPETCLLFGRILNASVIVKENLFSIDNNIPPANVVFFNRSFH